MRKMYNRIATATVFAIGILMAMPYFNNDAGAINAADIQSSPIMFYHESPEEPQLTQLQSEFDFADYISSGTSEFEEMALLKDWVYTRIPYDLNYNDSELRNALHILRRARKGDSFLCTTKSMVFMQCAVSLGWTSRLIFLKKPTQEEHAGNDIWSNQYRKWIYMDPTWNIHIERHGIPLSIREIRREWLKNNGRDIVYVFGAGRNTRRYTTRDLPVIREDSKIWKIIPIDATWLSYSGEIAVLGRNDFFSCCSQNGSNGWDPLYVVRNKLSWKEKIKAFFSNGKGYPPKMIFYELNRVDVKVVHRKEKLKEHQAKPIEVRLNAFGKNNYTPNFMEYLVKINKEDWKTAEERFEWNPEPGNNIVRARIMNRFGVVGPITEKRIYIPVKKKKEKSASSRKARH
jgi:hypothetical protein